MPVGQHGYNTHKLSVQYDAITPNWEARQKVLRALYNAERRSLVCFEWYNDRLEFLKYIVTLENWDNPDYYMCLINPKLELGPGNVVFRTSKIVGTL